MITLATLGGLRTAARAQPSPRPPPAAVTLPTCGAHAPAGPATAPGNAARAREAVAFRRAAQRGLDFVAREAVAWQQTNNCYGCHVQAVTLDALLVGRSHQYTVSDAAVTSLVAGMTTVWGGSRNDRDRLFSTAQAFSGATFARYDALVGPQLRDDLLLMATRLAGHQQPDGHVRSDDTRFPVEAGDMQATTQAVQTWRQVFERTADERWLLPIRRAEEYLQSQGRRIAAGSATPGAPAAPNGQGATIVDLNYAVMGLAAAGASPQEEINRALARQLRARQLPDGGWGYRPREPSNAFATGQTLYALRLLGADEGDAPVTRGMAWLVEHQGPDGSWSHTGSGKAEAMWSVLGLVSLDLLSVSVAGLQAGQHVGGPVALRLSARDNGGQSIRQLDARIDDAPVHRGCGASTGWTLDVANLARGMHTLEVVATNSAGRTSRRVVEFYTGDYYLAELASRFDGGSTVVSWRDLAPAATAHRVAVTVYAARDERGRSVRDRAVRQQELPGAQGPMSFTWDGRDAAGAAAPRGRYLAEVRWLDPAGRVVHAEELPFVHDTQEAQQAAFSEVTGRVATGTGGSTANATVELVNDRNEVVQRVTTTREGQYRFRNVNAGGYRVRVNREGVGSAAAPVQAAPAAAVQADMTLH